MIGLDYFLDEKWFKKNALSLKNQRFSSVLPATVRKNYSWNFKENFFDDRYLYDYLYAYKVDYESDSYRKFKYLEIISILMIDGKLKNNDPSFLFKKLEDLNNGMRPSTADEKLLANVLEVYDLIYQPNFPVNAENFELIIHILYRNIGYDLDIRDTYKRNEFTKTIVDKENLLSPVLIDAELENFWAYLDKPKPSNFSGFTEAMMLGLEMLYISPFDSMNVVLSNFVVKWYLYQLDQSFRNMNFNYMIGVNLEEYLTVLNKTFERNLNLDYYFRMIRKFSISESNMVQRELWLERELEKREELKKYFKVKESKMFMSRLLSIPDKTFNLTKIKKYLFLKEKMTKKESIDKLLNEFIEANILKKKKSGSSFIYEFADNEFEKTRVLLKD